MEKITKTTTPADEITSTTPATSIDTTAEITNTAREPVTEQAPTDTTPATSTPDTTAQIDPTPGLPAGYLADGTFMETPDSGKPYPKQEYVGVYAQQIAAALAPTLKTSAFNKAFVAPAKKALARGTTYGAQMSCVAGMTPAAIKLTAKGKTPASPILRDMIAQATAVVSDSATFDALHRHLDAIYSYMLLQEQQQKGGGI